MKKAFLKNFTIYTGNACVGVLQVLWRFFKPATWKKRLERFQYRCFPLNIKKFFKTLILKNICKRLLLSKSSYNYMSYIAYINLLIIYIKKIIHIYIYIIYMYIYIYICIYIFNIYNIAGRAILKQCLPLIVLNILRCCLVGSCSCSWLYHLTSYLKVSISNALHLVQECKTFEKQNFLPSPKICYWPIIV